jgi:3'(2'), 5'-bisphosphate nucleotidase
MVDVGDGWGAEDVSLADVAVAETIARQAGERLIELRRTATVDVGRRGDREAHELIVAALAAARPDDPVRSEEAPAGDGPTDDVEGRLWVVDPLDGTREYAEGLAEFAVHVALVVGGVATVGAVGLPALGQVLVSAPAPVVPPAEPGATPRLAVSRSRPPSLVHGVAKALGAELVPLGSAGYKVAAVVRGEVDAYVHAGGQYEWDSAAPVAVALAAGLHASRLDGAPLRYGRPDPLLPDLVVCRPELAGPILDACADQR